MKKNINQTFFAVNKEKNSVTSTEANHLANMAKERANALLAELEALRLTKDIMLKFKGYDVLLNPGEAVNADVIRNNANTVFQLFAFSAWLREGIKAKEKQMDAIRKTPLTIEFPEMKEVDHPKEVEESDIISEMNIRELSEYLALEAEAAHVGKLIHNMGLVQKMRKSAQSHQEVYFKEMNVGGGIDTFTVSSVLNMSVSELEDLFFSLQEQHRQAESKLNGFKARIKNEVTTRNVQLQHDFIAASQKAREEYNLAVSEYRAKNAAHEAEILAELKKVSELRILIPHAFTTVCEMLKKA